jgi:hypothetical protein
MRAARRGSNVSIGISWDQCHIVVQAIAHCWFVLGFTSQRVIQPPLVPGMSAPAAQV